MKWIESLAKLVLVFAFFIGFNGQGTGLQDLPLTGNTIDGEPQAMTLGEEPDGSSWVLHSPIPVTNGLSQTTSVVPCNGILYSIGGGLGAGPDMRVNRLLAYDAANDIWMEGAPIPVPQGLSAYGSAAAIGHLIYVFGGIQGSGVAAAPIRNLWIYDTVSNTWFAGHDMPDVRFGSAVAAVNGKIIVAGGGSTVIETTTWLYDPATDSYSNLAAMPSGFSTYRIHAVGLDDRGQAGQLRAFGGGFDGSDHWIYDVATNNWSQGPLMPFGVTDPGVVTDGSRIFVTGGFSGLPGRLQTFNLDTGNWGPSGPVMAAPVNNTSAGLIGGRIYNEGGFDGATSVNANQSTAVP